MPSGFSAAMTAAAKANRPLHATFDLTLDQVYKFAKGSVVSDSAGMYLDRVQSWGGWERSVDLEGHSLAIPTTNVVVNDPGRVLQKALGGPSSRNADGAPGQIWWRSFDVDAADHFNVVDGMVSDWRLQGDRLFFFLLAPDVEALQSDTNNIRKYTDVEWPNIPKENIGKDGQAVYGEHRSTSIEGQTGMVPCRMVDEKNLLWDVSVGKLFGNSSSIKQVWDNKTDATASFTHQEVLRGNKWHTLIKDTRSGGAEAVATDTITVDVDGIESIGDGTGTLVSNPVDVLSHFLVNFVYNEWSAVFTGVPPGRWLSPFTQAPLDLTSFNETSTFLGDRGYETGRVLKSSDSPLNVLTEWADSMKCYPLFMSNLKLGVRAIDHARAPYTAAANHLRQDLGHARSELTQNRLKSARKTRIFVNHLLRAADGSFFRTRRVEDSRRSVIITKDLDFSFGKTKVA